GSILDGNGAAVNFTGGTLTLNAQSNIGVSGNPLEMSVGTLNATASTGSMYLAEANSVVLGTFVAGTDITFTNATGNMYVFAVAFGDGGTATLTSTAGSIYDGNGAMLNITSGTLTLNAYYSIGTAGDPLETTVGTLNATATALTGSIYLAETDDITVNAVTFGSYGTASLTSTAGSILDGNGATLNFTGGTLTLNAQGSIGASSNPLETSVATLNATATTGSMYLAEANAVTLGTIAAGTATLTSTAGSILDGNGAALNFTGGTLTLNAQGSIGSPTDPLETSVSTLNATASTGSMYFAESDAVTLSTIAAGTDITITNTTGDMTVNAVTFGSGGTAILTSTAGSILDGNGETLNFTGGTLTLNAQGSIGSSGDPLETSVSTLNATASNGSIYLAESDAVTLGTIAAGTDIALTNATGDMTVGMVTFGSGGTAAFTSMSGSILDGNAEAVNFTGGTLDLVALNDIGSPDDYIDLTVTSYTATATYGNVYINLIP
ncbi:MAG: hypothetical protein V2A78_12060, partial [bacterium]